MALPRPGDGLAVVFQDRLCTRKFAYSRTVGLEPDWGYVHMRAEDLADFAIEDVVAQGLGQAQPVGPPTPEQLGLQPSEEVFPGGDRLEEFSQILRFRGALSTVARDQGPPAPASQAREVTPGRTLNNFGQLFIREQLDGVVVGEVIVDKVLVTEDSVEGIIRPTDGLGELVRVNLTDIRYLWESRGIVAAWVNVPKRGFGRDTRDPKNFYPGSLRRGRLWTLREVLEELILPNLPGQPSLRRLPESLEGEPPIDHIWEPSTAGGANAKRAFRDLLEEFQLEPALNLDSSVSIWKEREGAGLIVESRGGEFPFDINVAAGARIASRTLYRPATVLVIGRPVVDAQLVPLEPVGLINGELSPLEAAVTAIGFSGVAAAGRFVAQAAVNKEASAPAGVKPEALDDFRRWAFRWFLVRDGTEANFARIPVLDRPEPDEAGGFAPVLVFAKQAHRVNAAKLLARSQLNIGGAASPLDKALIDRLKAVQPKSIDAIVNLPLLPASPGSFEVDRDLGLVRFAGLVGTFQPEGAATFDEGRLIVEADSIWLEYGRERKPSAKGAIELGHYYHSIWTRATDGSATQVSGLPAGDPPAVIYRDDLQQVIALDGRTNKSRLDAVAETLAQAVFDRPKNVVAGVIEIPRPQPILTTGVIRSVTWTTSSDRPATIVHAGVIDPLAPKAPPLLDETPEAGRSAILSHPFLPRRER